MRVMITKTCAVCHKQQSLDKFETAKRGKYGKGTRCKKCQAQRVRAKRASNARSWSIRDPYISHPTNVKRCGTCKNELHIENFSKSRTETDGLQRSCRKCAVIMWQKRNYGRTVGEDDRCELCSSATTLGIDHCHSTGVVRGVLCRNCNTGLGLFKDNADLLRRAIKYLAKSR